MIRRKLWLALAAVGALTVTTAHAQINSTNANPRVFNDFSTSTLTIVDATSVNGGPGVSMASIDDRVLVDDLMGGNFANRHDLAFSSDGGATNHAFSINDSYTVKSIVTLAVGSLAPRKESGIRINSGITGDTLFLVNSDAGEIVAFGGGAPFFIFGSNGGANGYTPGTPILLGYTMTAFGDGNGPGTNTIEYFIDRLPFAVGGEATSGPLAYSNLEGGPFSGYNVALYTQIAPANALDFDTTNFNDIMFSPITTVPEPATCLISLLGIMGLAFIRRRGTR